MANFFFILESLTPLLINILLYFLIDTFGFFLVISIEIGIIIIMNIVEYFLTKR